MIEVREGHIVGEAEPNQLTEFDRLMIAAMRNQLLEYFLASLLAKHTWRSFGE